MDESPHIIFIISLFTKMFAIIPSQESLYESLINTNIDEDEELDTTTIYLNNFSRDCIEIPTTYWFDYTNKLILSEDWTEEIPLFLVVNDHGDFLLEDGTYGYPSKDNPAQDATDTI